MGKQETTGKQEFVRGFGEMCLPVLQVGAGDLLQKEVWFLHWVSYELATTTPTPAGVCPFPDCPFPYRQSLGKMTLNTW